MQAQFSRYGLSGDIRYGSSEITAHHQRDLAATFNTSIRLDPANSFQVSGSRSFTAKGSGSVFTLTVSYTHRFGASATGGFQFSNLLGVNRGTISGTVFFDDNGNARHDPGEKGLAGVTVRLEGKRTAVSDAQGHFSFGGVQPGAYAVSLVTNDIGMRWRATSRTEEIVSVSARETESIDFGVTNFGFVSGRVFNDLFLAGESAASSSPGVSGVRVRLQSIEPGIEALTYVVDASGMYEFKNLTPGNYKVELDTQTLPPDFRSPKETTWAVTVAPMRASYLDVPLAAQRAVSGIVFIDKDLNGKIDLNKDQPVADARVVAGGQEAVTDINGSYLLRGLPAGTLTIQAYLINREATSAITVVLGAEPILLRAINFAIERK
jgi:protocatechuate 3,4-dioxygenase beta subunit